MSLRDIESRTWPVGLPFFIGDGASGAVFDPSRKYRFSLWRRFQQPGQTGVPDCPASRMCAFVGLNPSTADESIDDPTIRRCIGFAKSWGFDGLVMLNLFAYRATKPADMKKQLDPVGCWNDECLQIVPALVGRTVCAWGANGIHLNRCSVVKAWLMDYYEVYCLRLTKHGHPEHPLYVPSDVSPILWTLRRTESPE
jgi:hypothetical protein